MPFIIFAFVCLFVVIYTPDHIRHFVMDIPKKIWVIIWFLGLGLCFTGVMALMLLGFCIVIAPVALALVCLMFTF